MTDDQIWHEAAQKLYKDIQDLRNSTPFDKFHFIALHNIYLLTSFMYYQHAESLITDSQFDNFCRYLLENFDEAEKLIRHPEETFTKDRLTAGTGFDLKPDAIWWNIILHYQRLMPDRFEMVRSVFVPKNPIQKTRNVSFFE